VGNSFLVPIKVILLLKDTVGEVCEEEEEALLPVR